MKLVLVHGTATDSSTWAIQRRTLEGFELCTYDRRGPANGGKALTTAEHADELAARMREAGAGWVCGSSYGAVVVIEAMRRHPGVMTRAVLCEPPLPADPDAPAVPPEWLSTFETCLQRQGGPAAAELFLRTVLGDQAYEGLPRRWQERSKALWRNIVADVQALAATRLDVRDLGSVEVPVLLLAGERSVPMYRKTLETLKRSFADARLVEIAGAGHMMHADSPRIFNRALAEFFGD